MLKKLTHLLFEDDDVFDDESSETAAPEPKKETAVSVSQPVATSAAPAPAVQPVAASAEQTAPAFPRIPAEDETAEIPAVIAEPKPVMPSINITADEAPIEQKTIRPTTASEKKNEEKPVRNEYSFRPVISPIFGVDEKDMNAVKTTTSKLTEKEKAKLEKNVTPIISPMYGNAVVKPAVKKDIFVEPEKSEEAVTLQQTSSASSPAAEDEFPEFSLDDILKTREDDAMKEDDLFGTTATSQLNFDLDDDEPLFPDLSFDDSDVELPDGNTTTIERPLENFTKSKFSK